MWPLLWTGSVPLTSAFLVPRCPGPHTLVAHCPETGPFVVLIRPPGLVGEEFTLLTKQAWGDEGRRQLTQSEQSGSHSSSSLNIQVLILCPAAAYSMVEAVHLYLFLELITFSRREIFGCCHLTFQHYSCEADLDSGTNCICLQYIIHTLFCFELQKQTLQAQLSHLNT